ncbi:hypothetical protein [Hydrogenophaga crassostreae]|uniref:Uncharacterized protein n=1 Tax=Hydrogenophaga crassostreae TaxID=1763535 RepID=A0A1D8P119_9BURK|nr:hypothetical protein [Hydrogenophaga crassostreae]AOW15020.1 hypothetical protein LPB072_21620 [Hydrogenophaga crassostreae]
MSIGCARGLTSHDSAHRTIGQFGFAQAFVASATTAWAVPWVHLDRAPIAEGLPGQPSEKRSALERAQ